MKTGTDVGIESAGVTLLKGDLTGRGAGGTVSGLFVGKGTPNQTSAFTVFESLISNGRQRPNSPTKVCSARRFIEID